MITVKDIKKDYSIVHRESLFRKNTETVHAVKGISFAIQDGERVGLIGVNGAGKTSTIKMMTGILTPTEGEILINGFVPVQRKREFLSQIGVSMGQRSCLFYDIALKESFRYYKEVYQVSDSDYSQRIGVFDQMLNIQELMDIPVRKLSFGQRKKAELVCALLHLPRVIFLDEPTIGLDVVVKENIFQFLTMLNQKYQTTILLTTHELESIEKFCQRIILLKNGRVLYDGALNRFAGMEDYRKISIPKRSYKERGFTFPNAVEVGDDVEFTINIRESDFSGLFRNMIFSDFTIRRLSLGDLIKQLEGEM